MHRLTFVFSICLFSISSLFAQASLRVSDQAVSRKEIKTIDGKQVKIQRLSEPNSPSNGDINLVKRDQYGKVIWSKFYGEVATNMLVHYQGHLMMDSNHRHNKLIWKGK